MDAKEVTGKTNWDAFPMATMETGDAEEE